MVLGGFSWASSVSWPIPIETWWVLTDSYFRLNQFLSKLLYCCNSLHTIWNRMWPHGMLTCHSAIWLYRSWHAFMQHVIKTYPCVYVRWRFKQESSSFCYLLLVNHNACQWRQDSAFLQIRVFVHIQSYEFNGLLYFIRTLLLCFRLPKMNLDTHKYIHILSLFLGLTINIPSFNLVLFVIL